MVTERYFKVSPEIPSYITDGRKVVATAGQRETLVSVVTPAKGVYITAIATNTGVTSVGGTTVVATAGTQQGTPLYANDTRFFPIDDLKKIYLDVQISGNGVLYTRLV